MAPSARFALAAGPVFVCRLALADSAVGFEAVLEGRRLTYEDYKFDTDLPPDRPVTDAAFFDDDFRQGVFQECGGKGKISYKCEEGCTCEIADGNMFSKRCAPPRGKKTCSLKVAKVLLSRQEDKVTELDKAVKTAIKEKEDAEAEIKRWARKAVIAKKEAEAAEKSFYDADAADTQHSKTQLNDVTEEIRVLRTKTIPQQTRETWEKYAKVISEAQAKIDDAKAKQDAVSKEWEKKRKLDNKTLEKLDKSVKKIEEKIAAMKSPEDAGAADAEE